MPLVSTIQVPVTIPTELLQTLKTPIKPHLSYAPHLGVTPVQVNPQANSGCLSLQRPEDLIATLSMTMPGFGQAVISPLSDTYPSVTPFSFLVMKVPAIAVIVSRLRTLQP